MIDIQLNKFYFTANGHRVRIYAIDKEIYGGIRINSGEWLSWAWDLTGCSLDTNEPQFNIVSESDNSFPTTERRLQMAGATYVEPGKYLITIEQARKFSDQLLEDIFDEHGLTQY